MSRALRTPGLFALAGTIGLATVLLLLGVVARKASSREGSPGPARAAGLAILSAGTGRAIPIPRSFLGISTEYQTVPIWERHGRLVARVLSLLRSRGGGPLDLRVGGDSADLAFWDPDGTRLAPWAVPLTPAWLRATRTLVRRSGARLMLDLNLVTGSPEADATWARAAQRWLPRGSIAAYEIGNEPDIYNRRAWLDNTLRAPRGSSLIPRRITSREYDRELLAYREVLSRSAPGVPLAGPALAHPTQDAGWISSLLRAPHPGLRTVTTHIYQLSACAHPGSPRYPTIARVLNARASGARARALAPAVAAAHRAGVAYRVAELNSVTCGGLAGVSNSFATALWAPQVLFQLLHQGVDGVNVHVRPDKINGAFALSRAGLQPRPLLYGLILFARTLGPDARLMPVRLDAGRRSRLAGWAVQTGRRGLHVLLINPGAQRATVELRLPATGPATVQRLVAPQVTATGGVTLDGQHLGPDGRWHGSARPETIAPSGGRYAVAVPRTSAALVGLNLADTRGTNV